MFSLSVRIDGKAQTIDLNDSQAKMIREKLNKKESQDEFVTLGLVSFKVRQIVSLFSRDQKMGTKDKIREELRHAAKVCDKCPKDEKGNGVGFVDAFTLHGQILASGWVPGCEVSKQLCVCQKTVKELNGIESENFDKLYAEFDLKAE